MHSIVLQTAPLEAVTLPVSVCVAVAGLYKLYSRLIELKFTSLRLVTLNVVYTARWKLQYSGWCIHSRGIGVGHLGRWTNYG